MDQTKTVVNIGSRLEMLVDEWLIDSRHNVSLQLHTPRREEIVWQSDKPWEGSQCCYFRVFSDGERMRMYYRGGSDPREGSATCYAESSDGIHFHKPVLGQYEYSGSKENNIVFMGSESDSYASHNLAPFLDANPGIKPEERYKATGGHRLPDGTRRVLYAFASPDGLHWKKLQEEPILTEGKFDSFNVAFWDEACGFYRCYSRYMKDVEGKKHRAIQSCTSPDFLNWSPVQHNVYEDEPPEFYTNATTPAPGAPHVLLSIPMRYVAGRKKIEEHPADSISDAMFMSSRDGVHWDRPFQEAWIKPNQDSRNWTDRSNMPAWGIVPTGDEYSVYLSEHYRWPDVRLRRYSVRRDGFASIHAGAKIGEWTTRPMLFSGSKLVLNYSTSAAGSIRVEVQDETGKPLPGFALADYEELYGNELDAVARWKSGADLSALQNRPVRLRFLMQEADLFALRFC